MELKGVYVPIVTPFGARGSVDHPALAELADRLLDEGAAGVVACGSTGEFYALSDTERLDVLRTVRDSVYGRATLVAGCNAGSTRDVVRHMQAAADMGYDAVMLAAPYYSLPAQDELVDHFQSVAAAVDIPIVLYNFPARTGVEIGNEVLDALQTVPNVVAIKESSGDITRLHAILQRYGDRYELICGADDQAFEYACWGVRSWIAGIANCIPGLCAAVLLAVERGELSAGRENMRRILPLAVEAERGKFTQKVKYGCELAGWVASSVRAPLYALGDEERQAVREAFEFAMSGIMSAHASDGRSVGER